MSRQNMTTPRFFINEGLYHQVSKEYNNSVLEFNPSNIKTFNSKEINFSLDDIPNYVMVLGNTQTFGLMGDGVTATSDIQAVNELIGGEYFDSKGYALQGITTSNKDFTLKIDGDLGTLSIGRYYDMPHSPELALTMSHEYKGVTKQTTMGGATLTNINYYKPPKWGDLEAWQLGDYTRKYSGRRIWDLAFNYINDEDLEPKHYAVAQEQSIYNDNWFSNVLYYTIGGTLPFVFQPNKDALYEVYDEGINSVPEFAICRFDMDTFSREQVAPNVYNIKVKIKETW